MKTLLLACAACYGQSDSPLAAGMNWGIFSLLGTIIFVLGAVVAFFVYLARRSAAGNRAAALVGPVTHGSGAAAALGGRHSSRSRLADATRVAPAPGRRRQVCSPGCEDLRSRSALGARRS